ncbi:MAG: ribonuclease HII [Eubacteriales bacterium]|nr:ribonuclease HII [Eubacteriales bacterium]MDD3863986.1 ribonuclease HII [Eubacteriales bacterium]
MTNEKRNQKLRQRRLEMRRYEEALQDTGVSLIAGVDEVGRGPLAGPVAAAAVILPPNCGILGIDDSKKLSASRRESLASEIRREAICWAIGWCDSERIDRINILQATKEAMILALQGLPVRPQHVLVDALSLPELDLPQTAIIRGDSLSVSIAAASILAKVARDARMQEYHIAYPGYAFDRNKGYGTRAHFEGLERQGLCPIHRRSFLQKYMERGNQWTVNESIDPK